MAYSKFSNADFLSWDDIQLTESEFEISNDSCSDLEDEIRECFSGSDAEIMALTENAEQGVITEKDKENSPKPKKKQKKRNDKEYKCPECGKCLKTIPGFRGHVERQHGKPELKAHDHKQSAQPAQSVDSSISSPPQIPLTTLQDLQDSMPSILATSFSRISSETVGKSVETTIKNVAVQPLDELIVHLTKTIHPVIEHMGSGTTMAMDREKMWRKFNELRFDPKTTGDMTPILEKCHVPVNQIVIVMHVLLEETLTSVISQQVTLMLGMMDDTETTPDAISDSDQAILYHICGFILHGLRKRYYRHKSSVFLALREMLSLLGNKSVMYEEESDYLNNVREWTNKCDRGGLMFAKKEFFLLVRQMEMILRKKSDITKLSTFTLQRDTLKETLADDFLVKHYIDMLVTSANEQFKVIMLTHIIALFLKTRGYAVAKYVRRQAQKVKRGKKMGKKGNKASLRKSLRDGK